MRREAAIPDWLGAATRIEIAVRQTTYWDALVHPGGRRCRIHFIEKAEFEFAAGPVDKVVVRSSHPLLLEYEEREASLYISSPTPGPAAVLRALRELCQFHFSGWRRLARYENGSYPLEDLLRSGFGLLLSGPQSFISSAADLLARSGITVRMLAGPGPRGAFEVLEVGRSFVVARRFEFEAIEDPVTP